MCGEDRSSQVEFVLNGTRVEIAAAVEMLLQHKSLTLQDPDVVAAALEVFRGRPSLGFSDCLSLEVARKAGHLPLGTFDRGTITATWTLPDLGAGTSVRLELEATVTGPVACNAAQLTTSVAEACPGVQPLQEVGTDDPATAAPGDPTCVGLAPALPTIEKRVEFADADGRKSVCTPDTARFICACAISFSRRRERWGEAGLRIEAAGPAWLGDPMTAALGHQREAGLQLLPVAVGHGFERCHVARDARVRHVRTEYRQRGDEPQQLPIGANRLQLVADEERDRASVGRYRGR